MLQAFFFLPIRQPNLAPSTLFFAHLEAAWLARRAAARGASGPGGGVRVWARRQHACGVGSAWQAGERALGGRLAAGAKICGARMLKKSVYFSSRKGFGRPPSRKITWAGRGMPGRGRRGASVWAGRAVGRARAGAAAGQTEARWRPRAITSRPAAHGRPAPKFWARAGAGAGAACAQGSQGARAGRNRGCGGARARKDGRRAGAGAGGAEPRPGKAAASPSLGARRPARDRQGARGAKHARSGAGQGWGRECGKARWCRCWVVVGVSRSDD